MAKRITLQDVARYAGVSAGTIDRVIHNRGRVSAEKREKIEKAIKDLNFNPNLLARTLALGRNYHICALIPSAPSPVHYWSMPVQGINTAASQYMDYGITTSNYYYDLFNEDSFTLQATQLLKDSPDAVVLAPLFLKESKMFIQKLRDARIPYVFIDADIPDLESLAYIGPDIKSSAYIAGRLLNSMLPANCEVLIVNMVKGFENASALLSMEAGFWNYFYQNSQSEPKTIHVLTINSTNKENVFKELRQFYKKHPAIKGTFVTNSKAFMVSEFHRIHNLDIRLVGYDLVENNIIHLRNGGIDFIISQNPIQQGQRAIQILFDYFVFKKVPERIQYVPLDIIIRENLDFYIGFNQGVTNTMYLKH